VAMPLVAVNQKDGGACGSGAQRELSASRGSAHPERFRSALLLKLPRWAHMAPSGGTPGATALSRRAVGFMRPAAAL
jgi:hypothetical protein